MRRRWLRPWTLVAFAVLALLAVIRYVFPCGLCGVDFWVSSSRSAKRLSSACVVFRTPGPWTSSGGETYETRWNKIDGFRLPDGWEKSVVRFHVRQLGRSRLIRLGEASSDNSATIGTASANLFRIEGGRLLTTSVDDWSRTAVITNAINFDKLYPALSIPPNPKAGGIPKESANGMSARFLYTGTDLHWDLFAVGQRTGLVLFTKPNSHESKLLLEYWFCRDSWIYHAASWSGDVVFTMPLDYSGETFVMCDFS